MVTTCGIDSQIATPWFNFTTGCPTCNQPAGVQITDVEHNKVRVNWDAQPVIQLTQVQYRPLSFPTAVNTVIAGSAVLSKQLTQLMPGTAYQSRTRHFCGEWGTSPFKYRGFVTNTLRTQNTDEIED